MTIKITIKCDVCGFTVEGTPHDWHHASCPKCRATDIVTDGDVAAYDAMINLTKTVDKLLGVQHEQPDR